MANFDIESFRAKFTDGARAYLFYMKPSFPTGVASASTTEDMTYLVKSANLPALTLGSVTIPWQGFEYKLAGKYTFGDWAVTFNVDVDAKIRTYYDDWMRLIHDPVSNIHAAPDKYMKDQRLQLLGGDGKTIMEYKLIGAWPSSVGDASLSYDSTEILTFEVTFAYQYHVVTSKAKAISI